MSHSPPESWRPVALYVHFPFCLSLCPYCDFVVYAGRAARGEASRVGVFLDAVVAEIALRARPDSLLRSVYLGGGTPSLMPARDVERLLAAIDRAFGIAADAEITIEANPGPAERGDLAGFRAAGVNRLSIGAQSLNPGELRRLGRRHGAADVATTVRVARAAGFDNISVDLLYDVPDQTIASWRATLSGTLALQPDHVSAYALNLDESEPGADALGDHLPPSRGASRWRAGARLHQDEDRAAEMYELAERLLADAGLRWYEISNWARPGAESRHNSVYWRGDAGWEAVGPGAHAFDGIRTRRWNAARLDAYIEALAEGRVPPGASETVDERTAIAEAAILRLRTREGITPDLVGAETGALNAPIAWATTHGLVDGSPHGPIRLTLRGRLISNEVFARLLPAS